MTTNEELLKVLFDRIRRAAKKKNDDFDIKIEVTYRVPNIRFTVSIGETADSHCIAGGSGTTLQEAIEAANEMFADGLKSWGYSE